MKKIRKKSKRMSETNFRGADYKCRDCAATGVKLWREYNTFLNHQRLLCAACANHDPDPGEWTLEYPGLGTMVPAVPTPEGDTFWGYTSTPQVDFEWWFALPYHRRLSPAERAVLEAAQHYAAENAKWAQSDDLYDDDGCLQALESLKSAAIALVESERE